MNKPFWIIIHHEAPSVPIRDNQKRFQIVDDYHASKGWGGIGYHYFIERDGEVIQGRKDYEEGAHTIGKNTESLGICMAGNMDIQLETSNQIKSLRTLINQKMTQYAIPASKVVGHRYFATYTMAKQGAQGRNQTQWKTWDNTQPYKSCPGSKLSDKWIEDLTKPDPVEFNTSTQPNTCVAEKETIKSLQSTIQNLLAYIKKLWK